MTLSRTPAIAYFHIVLAHSSQPTCQIEFEMLIIPGCGVQGG